MSTAQRNNVSANIGMTNDAALKNIDKVADDAAKAISTPVAPRVAHALLVSSIVSAGGSFKSAINTEVAVCLAVFAQFRGASLGAKKELYSIYKEAGYQCDAGGGGKDYKTVNRRVNYAAIFFASLPKGKVEEFMGDETHDSAAIQSVINHLTVEYNFRSMNDVLTAAGVTPPSKQAAVKKATTQAAAPAPAPVKAPQEPAKAVTATDQKVVEAAKARFAKGDAPTARQAAVLSKYSINLEATPEPDAGDKGVSDAINAAAGQRETQTRREMDSDKWIKLTFDGCTLIVPRDMKRELLGDLGIKLMTISNQMKGDKVDVKMLAEAFAVEIAH